MIAGNGERYQSATKKVAALGEASGLALESFPDSSMLMLADGDLGCLLEDKSPGYKALWAWKDLGTMTVKFGYG